MANKKPNSYGDGFKHIERNQGKDRQYVKLSFYVLNSDEYKALSASSKILMHAMQMQHRTNKYTAYGYRQAMGVTKLSDKTISKSFKELLVNYWIVVQGNYNHSEGKTRTWELTWMSYNGKAPKDTWRNRNVK